jgi:transposase
MKTELFSGGYIQADETPVGVQSGRTQGKNHQAYVFQYSHPRGTAIFDFQCSRERAGPRNFLQGFKGLLQTDGYTGYNKFEESSIERIGCMAHIRRKFFDAHKAGKEDPKPMEIVRQIAKLYQIEEEARETQLNAEQRLALRQEKSAPLMDALKSRIIELRQDPSVLPKSLLGKACSYGLNQ